MSFDKTTKKRQIGNVTETRVNVFKNGKNKNIESLEVRKLFNEFKKKADKGSKITIVGANPLQEHWTLKGFQDDDLNFEDYEDYFKNRVKDTSKFSKFTSLTFIVHIENKVSYKAVF